MGSHFPFEDLKFKLWSKERLGMKLIFSALTLGNNHIKPLQITQFSKVESCEFFPNLSYDFFYRLGCSWFICAPFGFNLHKPHFLFMCANWLHLKLMFAYEFVIIPFCSTPMLSFIVGIKERAMGFHFVTKLKIDYSFTLDIIE